ncbi:hypothetical protein DWB68_06010 [Galactobacter valiniphilus]|uniref:Uncharacterized protein n=1 Tax=Galactobacter valiniphilus TaxID=2676122 RepID=A0A399JAY2_9MICC|nr:hypothetical protein [Galactobacter valiniphilus]RII42698.1 hypothetical protein DWB68_06010 [Galactobacter valiniphilus]
MDLFLAGEPRRFVQIWPSLETGEWIVREGLLGRAGRLTETGLRPEAVPLEELAAPVLGRGFAEHDDELMDWVVIQFPAGRKSADEGLLRRAVEDVQQALEERGLGYVDGWDRGKRAGDGELVCHVFARSMDGELGAVAAMSALKWRRSDPQRATIAHRSHDGEEWSVRYGRVNGKLPGPFVL